MPETTPDSPRTFYCPNCGAALPEPDDTSVICQYCGSRILVPLEYQPKRMEDNLSSLPYVDQSGSPPRRSLFPITMILVVVFILILFGIISLLRATSAKKIASQGEAVVVQVRISTASPVPVLPTATPIPEPNAKLVLQFGGEGSGAGKFEDSRFISVDKASNIYVAEYSAGRVQKFDPTGKFEWLINVPEAVDGHATIHDMAVGMDGRVYVVRNPDILIYNPDGSSAGIIDGLLTEANYEALDIDPSNTLYAIHAGEDQTSLVKLNGQGEILQRVDDLDGQLGKHFRLSSVRTAVDGLGNSYLLNPSGAELYLFDSDGQFRDRVAGNGDQPGQLDFPMNVAVDGEGRLYLINQGQIQLLNPDGSFLAGFDWDYSNGSAFDLTLDLGGNLYVVTNNGNIFKYTLDIKD